MKKLGLILFLTLTVMSLMACDAISAALPDAETAQAGLEQAKDKLETVIDGVSEQAGAVMEKLPEQAQSAIEKLPEKAQNIISMLPDQAQAFLGKGGNAQLVNPITQYKSLEEVNTILNAKLTAPAVMGVTDEGYAIIDTGKIKIGEYRFEINDMDCCMRFSDNYDIDISGVYIDAAPAFTEVAGVLETRVADEETKLARWANTAGQYVLSMEDEGAYTMEDFTAIANEYVDLTNPAMGETERTGYYANLAGSYQDTVSGRAMAQVAPLGTEDGMVIVVSWANSAFETYTWTMTCVKSEDGLLYYNDCVESVIVYDESGNVSTETLSTDGSGYFSEMDGVLSWTGAADENCQSCTFARLEEIGE